ncbi:MAG TPA: hypothetical protein PKI20_00830 [Verrucomicrobiota bacterium]|jgi:exonuclease VII small subunit|nr:hypothetical protein [Verrucomicrobiota bacterium]
MQCLDAIERAEHRLMEQETTLKQTQQSQIAAIEARRRSTIEETSHLTGSLEKIHHAVLSELNKAGLVGANLPPATSGTIPQIPFNPQLADLSNLVKQVGKRAAALESSLRDLENHRDLQAKAARALQTFKSQPRPRPAPSPTKLAPRLITPPPPPTPQPQPPPPPAKAAWPTALLALAGIAALALALLLYYLLTK